MIFRKGHGMGFQAGIALLALAALPLASARDGSVEVLQEPSYDPSTVIDVMARVAEVRQTPPGRLLSGEHLIVKTESKDLELDVYLGPIEFLKQFEITFAPGDRLQIVGSKVKLNGAHVVLAREVRKADSTLYLRDAKGRPNWKTLARPAT